MFSQADHSGLQVCEICEPRDLVQYRAEWEGLLANASHATFFDTYEWLSTWLEFFWQDQRITFLLVRREGAAIALVPLLPDRAGELWCRHTFTLPVNKFATRADVIGNNTTADTLGAVCSYLRETGRVACLGFKSVLTASSLLPTLEQVARCRDLRIQRWPGNVCPIVRVDGDWDGYLASRSKHVCSEIRRKRRKLDRAGAARWRVVTSPADSHEAMTDILQIERGSWKEDNRSSFTAVPGLADFYGALSLRCALRGWLRTYMLYLDNVPVAHMLGIVYNNEYYALKTSFDEHFRDLSPGAVLATYALEQAFASRLHIFDFLGVPSRWKDELANDTRRHVRWCVFPRECYRCRLCSFFHNRMKPVIKRLPGFHHSPRTEEPHSSSTPCIAAPAPAGCTCDPFVRDTTT
jgi:CelD/BcsL family acetyltransferase involved in cellulose biosynthesis